MLQSILMIRKDQSTTTDLAIVLTNADSTSSGPIPYLTSQSRL